MTETEIIKEKTNNEGLDIVLDIVGGEYVQKNINILKKNGRLINLGWLTGSEVKINLLKVMLKRLIVTGSTLRIGTLKEKEEIAKGLKKNICRRKTCYKTLLFFKNNNHYQI